jgi:PilZ domain-containing protein
MKHRTTERRSSQRHLVHLDGRIAGTAVREPIECTVWDLSEAGVRLVVSEPADVPLEFELQIPAEDARARVRLVWTTGIHYGARFVD